MAALTAFGESASKDETAAFGDADTSDVFTEISRGDRSAAMARRIAPAAVGALKNAAARTAATY
jgi:hypothetical protein